MSAPEPEPRSPAIGLEGAIVCSTPPPFMEEMTPPQFVRFTLLVAVRDGFDQITLRPDQSGDRYDMVGRYSVKEYGIIDPSAEAVQEFPAILAGLGQPAGIRDQGRRAGSGHGDGSELGEFVFPIGPGSVRGIYRVRWERGVVAELEIGLPLATESVAAAARHDMRESARAVWGGEAETEPSAAPDPAA